MTGQRYFLGKTRTDVENTEETGKAYDTFMSLNPYKFSFRMLFYILIARVEIPPRLHPTCGEYGSYKNSITGAHRVIHVEVPLNDISRLISIAMQLH